jgi:phage FluMu protein Com
MEPFHIGLAVFVISLANWWKRYFLVVLRNTRERKEKGRGEQMSMMLKTYLFKGVCLVKCYCNDLLDYRIEYPTHEFICPRCGSVLRISWKLEAVVDIKKHSKLFLEEQYKRIQVMNEQIEKERNERTA